jgi:hypothetical protein
MWEWLFGGEDDKNVFDNIGDWWTGDDDEYSQTEESAFADLIDSDSDFADFYENVLADPNYGTTDVNSFMYEEDDPFAWLYESDPEFAASILGDDWMGEDQYGWNEDETSYIFPDELEDDYDGIFGLGIGPWLNQAFTGGQGLLGFLGGSGGNRSGDGGGIAGLLSSLAGGTKNMLDNDLIKILLGKKLLDDDREGSGGYVPIGQEAYGGASPLPDYRISNIQPALLPGMAYANQPTTFNNMPPPTAPPPGMQAGGLAHHHPQLHSHAQAPQGPQPLPYIPGQPGSRALPMPYKPDGMQAGGLASIPQGNKGLAKLPEDVRNKMGYMQSGGVASLENMMDGPGDITQAMLEPGEFVMTRKATENLTPEFLYKLMHQAENAGRIR